MTCCSNCPKVPVVRKCCFFVPIRKGVIVFGYVNLVLTLLALPLMLFLLVEEATSPHEEYIPMLRNPLVHLPITLVFLLTDVVMNIVLLIGAHKRSQKLLRFYLYFGLVFQLVTLAMDITYFDMEEDFQIGLYFFFQSLNIYLLFLVFNAVRVIEESSVRYVAHQDTRHLII